MSASDIAGTTALARMDLRGQSLSAAQLRRLVPRGGTDIDSVLDTVEPVVNAVRERGVVAAQEFSARFDGVTPQTVLVSAADLASALENLDPHVKAGLEEAIRRARIVHQAQRRTNKTTMVAPGGTVTEKWLPVGRVGLYVPGGNAVYPSSVIMNVVPAQEAGVDSLVVASPPQKEFNGLPHPTILAACALLGVTEVWAVGGAQAIALLAYGDTEDNAYTPVDMITGPGNIYVTAAKRLCRSVVGIDSEAGPTEIAILADAHARPELVAADMISQAEHDVLAAAVLVTDSVELADAVEVEISRQLATTKHLARIAEALRGRQTGIILVDNLEQGLAVVNAYGAEHLEIQTVNSAELAERVTSAGAIFVGNYSPVSLGDYCAGSNHVLPTSGSSRYSSGLSVQTFLRGVHLIEYSKAALAEVAPHVMTLAAAEDLPAHGDAVAQRFIEGNYAESNG